MILTVPDIVHSLSKIQLRLVEKDDIAVGEALAQLFILQEQLQEHVIEFIPDLQVMERRIILSSIEMHKGNKSKAARALKISYGTMCSRLSQYKEEGFGNG